jgi:excisionase family DNA binding protein
MRLEIELSEEQVDEIADRVARLLSAQRLPDDDGYLSSDAAAEFLGCPRSRIHDLVALRRLSPLRDGRRLRFRRSDLRAYLEESA